MAKIFYGWWVVLAALVLGAFSIGVGYFTVPIFYGALMKEFGWTRAQVVAGGSVALTLYGLLSPVAGLSTDRYGAKRTKLFGLIGLGIALALFSAMQSLWSYYCVSVLLGLGMSGIDGAPTQVLISRWFHKYEGLAMGIVVGGVGAGGFLGPVAASYLIENFNWRISFLALDAVLWLMVLPIFVLVVKESPKVLGLERDGSVEISGPLEHTQLAEPLSGISFREAVRTRAFWLLSVGTFALLFVIFAITQHWVLYLEKDRAISLQRASALLSLFFIVSIPGKIIMGYLADRFSRKWIMVSCSLCVSAGLVTLTQLPSSMYAIYASSCLLGLSYGSVFVILPLIAREYFGLADLGKILGIIFVFLAAGGSIGPLIVGKIRDIEGDYQPAFLLLLAVSIAALPIFLFMRPPREGWASSVPAGN